MPKTSRLTAEYVLKEHWDGVLPVNIVHIVRSLGINIHYGLFDDKENNPAEFGASGAIRYVGEKPVILINEHHSPTRNRFTIAHELGHFALHQDILKQKGFSDTEETLYRKGGRVDYKEVEANRFAAEVLMPKTAIDALIAKGVTTIDGLAYQFYVSEQAMTYRLKSLGYI